MRYFQIVFLSGIVLFFTACSQKKEISINKQITSISLDDEIYIAGTPKTVKSPFSINLGVGGRVARHVGIHVGTTVRPDIPNNDGVNLQKGIKLHDIALDSLIKLEFKRQMSNHPIYKDIFVPFGSDYKVYLAVSKYEFDDSLFSQKTHIKIYMELKVIDKFGNILYENKDVNTIDSNKVQYTQGEILRSTNLLTKTLNESISNVIAKLIIDMKNQ